MTLPLAALKLCKPRSLKGVSDVSHASMKAGLAHSRHDVLLNPTPRVSPKTLEYTAVAIIPHFRGGKKCRNWAGTASSDLHLYSMPRYRDCLHCELASAFLSSAYLSESGCRENPMVTLFGGTLLAPQPIQPTPAHLPGKSLPH